MTACAADIQFDSAGHIYTLPDGRVVPSVTEILGAVGVATNFEELGAMSAKAASDIDHKRALGSALHLDAHAFDDNDLDWNTVHPDVLPYLEAWVTVRQNKGLIPLTRERRVFHPVHFYSGTLDGIFITPAGRRILVDIKTGDPEDGGCRFQTAAYDAAYRFEHPDEQIHERWAVQLVPGLAVPYRITPYTAWRDFAAFQAFCTTYHHQAARRMGTR